MVIAICNDFNNIDNMNNIISNDDTNTYDGSSNDNDE